jgi:hypothetical protein
MHMPPLVLSNVGREILLWAKKHQLYRLGQPLLAANGTTLPRGGFQTLKGLLFTSAAYSIEANGAARYEAYVSEGHWCAQAPPHTITEATSRFSRETLFEAHVEAERAWREKGRMSMDWKVLCQPQPRPWLENSKPAVVYLKKRPL